MSVNLFIEKHLIWQFHLKMVQHLPLTITVMCLMVTTSSSSDVKIKKCCQKTEMLDMEMKKCLPKAQFNQLDEGQKNLKVLPDVLFDVVKVASGVRPKVENNLFNDDNNLVLGFPTCRNNDLQILTLNDSGFEYFLNKAGRLVSFRGEYELSLDFGDFCIDLAANRQDFNVSRVAVACNPCSHATCIKTCCPHPAGLTKDGQCKFTRLLFIDDNLKKSKITFSPLLGTKNRIKLRNKNYFLIIHFRPLHPPTWTPNLESSKKVFIW